MNELIQNYTEGKIKFSKLVSRLDELITNLDNPPQEWIEGAKSLWFDLEEINAVLLDEKNKDRTVETFKTDIAEIIKKLSLLIAEFP